MLKSMRTALVLAAVLTLSACASVTLAPAGAYQAGKAGPQVTLGRNWADISAIMVDRPK